ncbi:MAG: hypothetical protein QXX84_07020 [Sulfolobales archaeon]
MQTKEEDMAMKKFNNQEAGRPGNSPAPGEVERGIVRVLEIIIDALYEEDILTIGDAIEIDGIITRIKKILKKEVTK